jgi:hypothetical protein
MSALVVGILKSTVGKVSIAFIFGVIAGGSAAWIVASKFGEARLLAAKLSHEKEVGALAAEALKQSERVLEFERTQRILVSEIEERYEKEKARLTTEAVDARALADRLGGLRDPGKTTTIRVPRSDCPEVSSRCGAGDAKLSREASEFLLALGESADRDANLARECVRWAREVKKQQETFSASSKNTSPLKK